MIRSSTPGTDERFFSSPESQYHLWSPTSLVLNEHPVISPGSKRPGCEVSTHLHMAPRLNQNTARPLPPLLPHTSTYLPLYVLYKIHPKLSVYFRSTSLDPSPARNIPAPPVPLSSCESYVTKNPQQISLGRSNHEECDGNGIYHVRGDECYMQGFSGDT